MEKRNISVLCPVDLHRRVKMRMLDELGDDNFTRLILGFLEQYANVGIGISNKETSTDTEAGRDTSRYKEEIDRLVAALDLNPEVSRAYLLSLDAVLKSLGIAGEHVGEQHTQPALRPKKQGRG